MSSIVSQYWLIVWHLFFMCTFQVNAALHYFYCRALSEVLAGQRSAFLQKSAELSCSFSCTEFYFSFLIYVAGMLPALLSAVFGAQRQ